MLTYEQEKMCDEAIDVGRHAGQEACETIARICTNLPDYRQEHIAIAHAFAIVLFKFEKICKKDPDYRQAVMGFVHILLGASERKQG